MRQDKDKALALRKQGKSYSEIQRSLGIPKSTLSVWLHNIAIPKAARKRLDNRASKKGTAALIKRNKEQTTIAAEKAHRIRKKAASEIGQLSQQRVKDIGIALYWGEGYKKGAEGSQWKCVDFVNADHDMIFFMMYFFRKICKVPEEKFRIHLALHSQQQEKTARIFWSNLCDVPLEQFVKTSFARSSSSMGKSKRKIQYGTVHIRIHDVALFFQIVGWIDGFRNQIKRK